MSNRLKNELCLHAFSAKTFIQTTDVGYQIV
jgi:hypothetical protein